MNRTSSPARSGAGRARRFSRALAGAAVLAAVVAGALAVHQHRSGYYFRHLKPNEWLLRWRGVYRFDAARQIVRQGAPSSRMVALTFDDGPQALTPEMLDVLKAHEARATFFLVGSNVKRRPEMVRRMAAEGHDLGNHSRSHASLPSLRDDQIRNEIVHNNYLIARATGRRARLFRPPGGQYDDRVLAEVVRQGLTTVLWSNNTGDWKARDPAWLVKRVLSSVESGDIVLMHETRPETLESLPAILAGLRARGFLIVTVREMMDASGYPLSEAAPAPAAARQAQ